MYKSDKIALALCGLGVATIFILSARSCDEVEAEETPVVSTGTSYPNNYYVNGAGWYHASSGRFYPYVFNHYEAGRGYYHDGLWTPAPGTVVAAGNPTWEGAKEANARVASTRSSSFSSGSSGSGGHGGSFSSGGHGESSGSSRGGFGTTGGGKGGSSS